MLDRNGGARRDRTDDLKLAKLPLYQLSYGPLIQCLPICQFELAALPSVLVGRGGLEPPTSRLSGVRSNHLSYRPVTHNAKLTPTDEHKPLAGLVTTPRKSRTKRMKEEKRRRRNNR